jgi:hypothetical protein
VLGSQRPLAVRASIHQQVRPVAQHGVAWTDRDRSPADDAHLQVVEDSHERPYSPRGNVHITITQDENIADCCAQSHI